MQTGITVFYNFVSSDVKLEIDFFLSCSFGQCFDIAKKYVIPASKIVSTFDFMIAVKSRFLKNVSVTY